nr:TIM barrel protein [Clostridia bacterium]
MLYSGIVSLTQKLISVDELIELAKKSGLTGVEWSSNCHVPEDDLDFVASVKEKCDKAGLRLFSDGSFYRAGQGMESTQLLKAAKTLGAPNIRIWAGSKGSAAVEEDERAEWTKELTAFVDEAAEYGLTVSFEYHNNTLTDDADSAIRLIKEIDRPNVYLYWQPNQFKDVDFNTAALTKILPYVTNVHTFCWVDRARHPLADGIAAWNEYIRILKTTGRDHALLMEFVADDLYDNVIRDAETLNKMLANDTGYMVKKKSLKIPYSEDTSVLNTPLEVAGGRMTLKNRLTIHPMEGFDGKFNGGPDELTFRRYERFAKSGASLIWFEATAIVEEARTSKRQLWINKDSADDFKRIREEMHKNAPDVPVVMQLTHSGRFSAPQGKSAPVIAYHNPILNQRLNVPADLPVVTDDYLDSLVDRFVEAATLAKECGFDGVDIKNCHRYLMSELMSAYNREGRYGGSFENRTRLMRDVVKAVNAKFGKDLVIVSRFGICDAIEYPYGFGVDKENPNIPDLSEPIALLSELMKDGLAMIDMTMGTPYFNPHVNRPYATGGYAHPEHPLAGTERLIHYTGELKKALPDLKIIGTGYSYLGESAQYVGAGAVSEGYCDAVGFGRMAFAYPDFAKDILAGQYDKKKACITCGKCTEIMRKHMTTGCPVRDTEVYLPIYKEHCLNK